MAALKVRKSLRSGLKGLQCCSGSGERVCRESKVVAIKVLPHVAAKPIVRQCLDPQLLLHSSLSALPTTLRDKYVNSPGKVPC